MTAQSGSGREPFTLFLQWLSTDRDLAIKKHDEIMRKLNKYFVRKGCPDSEELAGETRDRVIKIVNTGREYPNTDALFYSVASKVWYEYGRKPKTEPLPTEDLIAGSGQETEDRELRAACLEKCLAQLTGSEYDLITHYYQAEGRETSKARRSLMDEHGGENTLRVKAYRIRIKLRSCIRACIAELGK